MISYFMMNAKTKKIVMAIVVILGVGFVYFSATVLVPRVLITLTRAAPATKVSLPNSYLLGSKILCKADGVDGCVVNVFLGDSDSRPVSGKTVSLTALGAEVSPALGKTDETGKVSFFLTSKTESQVEVVALVDGTSMGKMVTVTFRGN